MGTEPRKRYKQLQGYAEKGKVAKLLNDGWKIESCDPIVVGGVQLKQSWFVLSRVD